MSLIHEIDNAVRTRRRELGLSQAALAKVSGLPLSAICSAEGGAEPSRFGGGGIARIDRPLPADRDERFKDDVRPAIDAPARSALEVAAATASVSYAGQLSGEQLQHILLDRQAPHSDIRPHLTALLDEAPMSLLARVVDEMNTSSGLERAAVWARMGEPSQYLKCGRMIWRLRQGQYCEALTRRGAALRPRKVLRVGAFIQPLAVVHQAEDVWHRPLERTVRHAPATLYRQNQGPELGGPARVARIAR